ncbi:MAG TPA: hypothetical protein VEK79_02745 [Thermoanaerobaculia bacterium]|nr:hypothetical protein [Thermoanaerobaculia bacterium]
MAKTLAFLTLVAAFVLPVQPAAALEVDSDLLALVAMPLAVAAVSEITDVPASDLIDVVTLLNDADVPPAQFVEVVRYVPVALVVEHDTQPRFIEVIRAQEQAGVRGPALVTFIEQRLHTFGVPATVDFDVVTAPQIVELERNEIVPAFVRTRIANVKAHPQGGPPGQLKKAAGLQTSAEIVHRTDRRDVATRTIVRTDDNDGVKQKQKEKKQKEHKVANAGRGDDDHGGGHGRGKGKGSNGKGKGKG